MSFSTLTCGSFYLMMWPVDIYFITITFMATTQGLHQNCFNYCKHLSNQPRSLSRRDCNCTAFNHENLSTDHTLSSETKNIEIGHKPLKPAEIKTTQHHEISTEAVNLEAEESINGSFSIEASTDGNGNINSRSIENDKASNEYSTSMSKNTIEFPLYLDIDLHAKVSVDTPNLKEELIHIFEKVRASEKDVSECVNLHIYIFSKNNDNRGQSHTNWGHVKHDNISDSELLTEIQNKCDQPTTVIHESIYEIRQREQKGYDSPQDIKESSENKSITDEEDNISMPDESSRTNQNIYHVPTHLENDVLLETTTVSVDVIEEDMDTKESQIMDESSSAALSDEEYFNISRDMTNRHESIFISDIDSRDSISHKGFRRLRYSEEELLIPKIITKEFPNNTVISIIDGYETLPNLDFVANYYDMSEKGKYDTPSNETYALIPKQPELSNITDIQNGNNSQSEFIQDINGNLYFLYGNSQIPARFIQNSEGEMQLAVDGYSLCDQITQRQEKGLMFMNLLCGCIKFHNCSRSLS